MMCHDAQRNAPTTTLAPTAHRTPRRARATALRALITACSLAVLSLGAPHARAQGTLPTEIVESQSELTAGQLDQVSKFVSVHLPDLQSTDPEKIMAGRKALIAPLTTAASVAFRLKYAEQLAPELSKLVKDGEEKQQINALVIAGQLASQRCMEPLTVGRASKLPSVRFQAAAESRRMIESLSTQRTLQAGDATALMKACADALDKETDALVSSGLVAAIGAGVQVKELQSGSLQGLADAINGMARRAKDAPVAQPMTDSMGRACMIARDFMQSSTSPTPSAVKACADVAATVLWHVKQVVEGGKLSTGDTAHAGRDEYAGLAKSAEAALQLSGQVSQPKVSVPESKLDESLRMGKSQADADAVRSIQSYLDVVSKPPFNIPRERFQR